MDSHLKQRTFKHTCAMMVLATLIITATIPPKALSHPHVFIAKKMAIVFDQKGLAGLRIVWTFDEMFTALIAEDFDLDGNRQFDADEISTVREKAFSYIAPYNYYIHISIDGSPFDVRYIQDFHAELDDGKLIYRFFIPCHVTATTSAKEIKISPYDPEYYSDFYFPQGRPVTLENSQGFEINAHLRRDMSTLIYYETVNPMAIFMTFKLKS